MSLLLTLTDFLTCPSAFVIYFEQVICSLRGFISFYYFYGVCDV